MPKHTTGNSLSINFWFVNRDRGISFCFALQSGVEVGTEINTKTNGNQQRQENDTHAKIERPATCCLYGSRPFGCAYSSLWAHTLYPNPLHSQQSYGQVFCRGFVAHIILYQKTKRFL